MRCIQWKNSYVTDLMLQQLGLNKMMIIFNVVYVQIVISNYTMDTCIKSVRIVI